MRHPIFRMVLLVLALACARPAFAQTIQFVTSLDSTPINRATAYNPGDTIYVCVTGFPQDALPFNNKILATITTSRTDTEQVYLFETDIDGVFTGFINTRFGNFTTGDGVLQLRGNDSVTVSFNGASATLAVAPSNSLVILDPREQPDTLNPFSDPLPTLAGELKLITAGASILIEVVDDQRNTTAGATDTVTVTANTGIGDSEILTLTETAVDSGIFAAVVPTAFAATPIASNNILEVQAGASQVTVGYTNPFTTNPPAAAALDVRGGINGTLALSPSPVTPGVPLIATINDADSFANAHSGPGNDTVTVTLTSFNTGGIVIDRETLLISEDNLSAGLFTQAIHVSFVGTGAATVNDGVVGVVAGGTITATYNDELQASGQTNVPVAAVPTPLAVSAPGAVVPAITFVSDLNCSNTVSRVTPGDTLFLCVQDAAADLSDATDRITLTITTNADLAVAFHDVETVALIETGPHTGVFSGSIDTLFASVIVPNNGTVDVRGRDVVGGPQVTATYTSVSGVSATAAGLAVNIVGNVGFTTNGSGVVSSSTQFRAGDPLFVSVVDDDANSSPTSVDTITVTLTAFSNQTPPASPLAFPAAGATDQEVVILRETDVNTGIFVRDPTLAPFNFIPTAFIPSPLIGSANNGVLEVRADGVVAGDPTNTSNTVVAEFGDTQVPDSSGTIFRRASIFIERGVNGAIAVADATPVTPGTLTGGNNAVITVTNERFSATSISGGFSPSTPNGPANQTLTVTLTSFNAGGLVVDTEVVIIGVVDANLGTYQGLYPTRYVPPTTLGTSNNGVLSLVGGGTVRASFVDYLRENGQPNALINSTPIPVAGPVAGTVDFVNSSDAATATILSRIEPGDTVYIRVIDRDLQGTANGGLNSVSVNVTTVNPVTGLAEDTETVVCQESTTPGVFFGTIQTIFAGSTPGIANDAKPGNGTLEVRGRNTVSVAYTDLNPAGIRVAAQLLAVEVLASARFLTNGGFTQQQGNNIFTLSGPLEALKVFNTIASDTVAVRGGDPIFFAVLDDDANRDPATADAIAVTVACAATGDTETVTLTESGVNTGAFNLQGALQTGLRTQLVGPGSGSNPGDGQLQVNAGAAVTLTFQDLTVPTPPTGAGATVNVVDTMQIQAGGDAVLAALDSVSPDAVNNTVKAGDPISITVTEPLAEPRFNPNVIDTIQVTVSSGGTAPNLDLETVQLAETGLDTRVFAGSVNTVFSNAGLPGNHLLEISNSDATRRQIVVTYVDPQPLNPGTKANTDAVVPGTTNVLVVTRNLFARGAVGNPLIALVSTQCNSASEFVLGDTIRVSVTDPSFDGMGPGLTVNVSATSASGDVEVFTLQQVGTTSDFTNDGNRIPTSYDQSIIRGDSVMEMVGGSTSTTAHGEPLTIGYSTSINVIGQANSSVLATMLGFTRATVRVAVDRTQSSNAPASPQPASSPPPQPLFGSETQLFTKDDTVVGFAPGDRVFFQVIDPDRVLANSPQTPNTVQVTVTTVNLGNPSTPGDSELVTLTLQPRLNGQTVRGTYIGSIATAALAAANSVPTRDDGTLQIIGHDVVTVTYSDVNSDQAVACLLSTINTSTESRNDGTISFVANSTSVAAVSTVSLVPPTGSTSAFAFIRVVDKDFDTDNRPGTDAGPQLTITTVNGDTETVATTESTSTPGEFRAQVPLIFPRSPVANSGSIEVVGGDTITACYSDEFNTTPGFTTQRCAAATVPGTAAGSGATIQLLNPVTGVYYTPNRLEELIIGEPVNVQVIDPSAASTTTTNAVTVLITTNNPTQPDQETLILTETAPSTGVFKGALPTAFPTNVNSPPNSAARFNNGVLSLVGGDTVTITYVVATVPNGNRNIPISVTINAAKNYYNSQAISNRAQDGTVLALANGAQLIIPAGAVQLNQKITFSLSYNSLYTDEFGKLVPPPLNPAVQLVGDSGRVGYYQVTPSNLVFKKLVTFQIPIPGTVTLQGSTTTLSTADRARLKLFFFDGFDWQPSAGQLIIDGTGRQFIQAFTNHLSLFTLALDNRPPPPMVGTLLTAITLDKNPFTPNADGINDTVTIQFGLGEESVITVKVLDSTGETVRTLLNQGLMQPGYNTLMWDGHYNFSTRNVPAGLYVIVVTAQGAGGGTDTQSVGVGVLK